MARVVQGCRDVTWVDVSSIMVMMTPAGGSAPPMGLYGAQATGLPAPPASEANPHFLARFTPPA